MEYPGEYTARGIVKSLETVSSGYPDGGWGPARALPYEQINPIKRLAHRLRLAWRVFTGRADALTWD